MEVKECLPVPEIKFKDPGERIEFWGNVPFMLLHAGCLLVFAVGYSPAVLWVLLLTMGPRMFGLTAGYHRYFSHRSFKTSRAFQFVLALLGAASLQKDPMWWAAHHRNHHRYTDTEKDAHSPKVHGFFWAHMGWFMCKKHAQLHPDPLVPDLAKYPELVFLNRHQKTTAAGFLLILAAAGYAAERFFPGWELTCAQTAVWGFFVSTILLHHATFCVNSVSHLWGTRPYDIEDDSRNNPIVAVLTMGEGWHNNHHKFPYSEKHGLKWWQLDMTHGILKMLSWFRIVWDLNEPREVSEAKVTA